MRSALILLAIGLSLMLGLLLGATLTGSGSRPFTTSDEIAIRERWPGGTFVDNDRIYRTCENGYEVHRYADGRSFFFPGRSCWK